MNPGTKVTSMTKNAKIISPPVSQHEDVEAALVAEAKRDLAAFDQLYDLYVQPLYRFLLSRISDVQGAEEVTAQTFLAALEGFPRYRHQGQFAAWLFSIARNKVVDYFRQERGNPGLDETAPSPNEADPLQHAIKTERVAKLTALISELPEEERELIRLRFVAEMRFSEIASLIKRKEDTVKKSLYRLLARLKSQVEVKYE
jgi:RNA polymerase sigma-70 factor (ECF subfamily)